MKPCAHREAIVLLARNGNSATTIGRQLNVNTRTVQRIMKRWREEGNVDVKRKTGRPRSVNTRRLRGIIKKKIDRNDGVSMNRIASTLGISRTSVQKIVKNELGLRSYRLLSGQYLSEESKASRLKKCRELLKIFAVRRVEDVLWTDEKIFTVEVAKNRQNDRQLISPVLKNTRRRKIATHVLFPESLMVWGGITATGKTPLIFVEKGVKINAVVYQNEILKKAVMEWKKKNPNMILQQDWAPAHRAKSTITYLETHFPGFLNKNQWPASSCDLNPLDFSVWGYMQQKLVNKNIRDLNTLRREIVKIWDELDVDYLRRTVESVIPRLKACIKAEGGHFEQLL